MAVDLRAVAKAGALWGVSNHDRFTYSQGANRNDQLLTPYPSIVTTDCSGFCTYLQAWTGCQYMAQADTQSYGATYPQIPVQHALVSDAVIYGLNLPLEFQHMAWLVEPGTSGNPTTVAHGDPLTVGDGFQGAPAIVDAIGGNPHPGEATITYIRLPMDKAVSRTFFPPGMLVVPGTPAALVDLSRRPGPGQPPTLQYGDTEPIAWIHYARWVLEAARCGPVDGRFIPNPDAGSGVGDLTRAAIKRFQMRNGIPPTGVMNDTTWIVAGVVWATIEP